MYSAEADARGNGIGAWKRNENDGDEGCRVTLNDLSVEIWERIACALRPCDMQALSQVSKKGYQAYLAAVRARAARFRRPRRDRRSTGKSTRRRAWDCRAEMCASVFPTSQSCNRCKSCSERDEASQEGGAGSHTAAAVAHTGVVDTEPKVTMELPQRRHRWLCECSASELSPGDGRYIAHVNVQHCRVCHPETRRAAWASVGACIELWDTSTGQRVAETAFRLRNPFTYYLELCWIGHDKVAVLLTLESVSDAAQAEDTEEWATLPPPLGTALCQVFVFRTDRCRSLRLVRSVSVERFERPSQLMEFVPDVAHEVAQSALDQLMLVKVSGDAGAEAPTANDAHAAPHAPGGGSSDATVRFLSCPAATLPAAAALVQLSMDARVVLVRVAEACASETFLVDDLPEASSVTFAHGFPSFRARAHYLEQAEFPSVLSQCGQFVASLSIADDNSGSARGYDDEDGDVAKHLSLRVTVSQSDCSTPLYVRDLQVEGSQRSRSVGQAGALNDGGSPQASVFFVASGHGWSSALVVQSDGVCIPWVLRIETGELFCAPCDQAVGAKGDVAAWDDMSCEVSGSLHMTMYDPHASRSSFRALIFDLVAPEGRKWMCTARTPCYHVFDFRAHESGKLFITNMCMCCMSCVMEMRANDDQPSQRRP